MEHLCTGEVGAVYKQHDCNKEVAERCTNEWRSGG